MIVTPLRERVSHWCPVLTPSRCITAGAWRHGSATCDCAPRGIRVLPSPPRERDWLRRQSIPAEGAPSRRFGLTSGAAAPAARKGNVMQYRQLGKSGLRVSVLALGTMTLGGR